MLQGKVPLIVRHVQKVIILNPLYYLRFVCSLKNYGSFYKRIWETGYSYMYIIIVFKSWLKLEVRNCDRNTADDRQ